MMMALKDCAVLFSGQHLKPNEYAYSIEPNSVPYLSGPNDLLEDAAPKFTFREPNSHSGDILIVVKGSGSGELFRQQFSTAYLGRQLMSMRATDEGHTDFLAYWLSTRQRELESRAVGNLIPGLGRADILTLKIPLPPLPTQRRIAAVLQTWDCAIALATQQLADLRERTRGLMQLLLTGGKRLPGFEGAWEEVRLGDLVEVEYGKSKPLDFTGEKVDGSFPVVSSAGTMGYSLETLAPANVTILGRKGTIDKPFYVSSPSWPVDTTFYCAVKPGFDPEMAFNILASVNWMAYNEGSNIPSLSRNSIRQIRLWLPELAEQKEIASVIKSTKRPISILERQLRKLHSQKQGLMQRLLDGDTLLPKSFDKYLSEPQTN